MTEYRWNIKLEDVTKRGDMSLVDVTQEMMDLQKMYKESLKMVDDKRSTALFTLTTYMKAFIEIEDMRMEMLKKLDKLESKMSTKAKYEEDEEEE